MQKTRPLAERMRPNTLDDVVGQSHLVGEGSPLRIFFQSGNFPSIILWGPPGVGKTTFAQLIANIANYTFFQLSAIDAGVKEVRAIIASAQNQNFKGKQCLLFIDEIHRFNKSQQDALLKAVEKGIVILIGATTENPSFEVNAALLSRCQVYHLKLLGDDEIVKIIDNAIKTDYLLKQYEITIEDYDFICKLSGGDARAALNALELATKLYINNADRDIRSFILTHSDFEKALQQKTAQYDKAGESHYDTISAFIKSLRGSDPDAAMYWMAKMLDAGEDPKFIARRMVIFASEDIGNADPFALSLAISVFNAVQLIGMPECRINLAQGVTYLASCAKSNASYMALEAAMADIRGGSSLFVPLHLRNAPTKLMKEEGYGSEYKYPHNFENHFVSENYFPPDIEPKVYYYPGEFGKEKVFGDRLKFFWKNKKHYE
ncbi:MAG: replication-associated recombination protein A [Ignavibacteria bacterium]|nr:replication-associated recombination protein A [Ignavibacteria bacterium]